MYTAFFIEYVASAYYTFFLKFLVDGDFPRMAYTEITTRYSYIAHVL